MSLHPTTSIDAYGQGQTTGTLLSDRVSVALAFRVYGPGTSAEVLAAAGLDSNLNLRRARVTELEDMGLLRVVERRTCGKTGARAKALVWDPANGPREKTFAVEITAKDLEVLRQVGTVCQDWLEYCELRDRIIEQTDGTSKRLAGLLKQRKIIIARVEEG